MCVHEQIKAAEEALSGLASEPGLTVSQRKAVRGCLGTIRGIGMVRAGRPQAAAGDPMGSFWNSLRLLPVSDPRTRQLPTGDRDGGHDDAA